MIDNTDGLLVWAYGSNSGTNLRFYCNDRLTGNSDFYVDGGTFSNLLYFTFYRNCITLTLDIYMYWLLEIQDQMQEIVLQVKFRNI